MLRAGLATSMHEHACQQYWQHLHVNNTGNIYAWTCMSTILLASKSCSTPKCHWEGGSSRCGWCCHWAAKHEAIMMYDEGGGRKIWRDPQSRIPPKHFWEAVLALKKGFLFFFCCQAGLRPPKGQNTFLLSQQPEITQNPGISPFSTGILHAFECLWAQNHPLDSFVVFFIYKCHSGWLFPVFSKISSDFH